MSVVRCEITSHWTRTGATPCGREAETREWEWLGEGGQPRNVCDHCATYRREDWRRASHVARVR